MTEETTKATKKAPARKKKAPAGKRKSSPRKRAASSKASSGGGGHLVIVESPTKAKTLTRYLAPVLGRSVKVRASYGHIRDLPSSKLGVDTEKAFAPTWEVMAASKKVVSQLKQAAKGAEGIWLATDLDREGEAIAWHVLYAMGLTNG